MKIEFIDEPNDFPKLKFSIEESSVEVIAHDFLAACIASMGFQYKEVLKLANAKLEPQKSSQKLNEFLQNQKDKRIANLDPTILNPSARPVGVGTVRTNVTILPSTKEKARRIGDGNISRGIDLAVEKF